MALMMGNSGEDYLPEDDAEETFGERLVGLTEMFPERFRDGATKSVSFAINSVKKMYGWSRNISWLLFSSSVVALAPVIFESERFSMEEQAKLQQRQMLLGPKAIGPSAAFSR